MAKKSLSLGGQLGALLLTVVLQRRGAGVPPMLLTLGTAAVLVFTRTRLNYGKNTQWSQLRHFKGEILTAHVLAGGWLVAMTDRIRAIETPLGPGGMLRDTVLAQSLAFEQEHPEGFDDIRSSVAMRFHVFYRSWITICDAWGRYVFRVVFVLLIAMAGLAAGAQLLLGYQDMALLFGLMLAVSAIALVVGAHGHLDANPGQHQSAMVVAGLTQIALSLALWDAGVGFAFVATPEVGWALGATYGATIVVWQWCAHRDPEGDGKACRLAARLTGLTGGVLIALNIYERLHSQVLDTQALLSMWPIGVIVAAFLAAISPRSWGVGSRFGAMRNDPIAVDGDPDDDGANSDDIVGHWRTLQNDIDDIAADDGS